MLPSGRDPGASGLAGRYDPSRLQREHLCINGGSVGIRIRERLFPRFQWLAEIQEISSKIWQARVTHAKPGLLQWTTQP
jgi:hypothetical protein